jgi:hypothetical protein
MKPMHVFPMMVLTALLLAACGGGGGGGQSEPPAAVADPLAELPAAVNQSAAAMAGYMSTLATVAADDREPLGLDGFNPPQPDDTEPEAVGG